MALTRSREKVYLSYPLFDAEERACLPSFFVEEVRRCFAKAVPTTFVLEPGELRRSFDGLDILFYEEVSAPEAVARMVARRSGQDGMSG